MELKNNERLKELKLALYISHIDKTKNKIEYSNIIKMLDCLAATMGKAEHVMFLQFVQDTVGNNMLGASNKHIVATLKTYFSNTQAAAKMGMATATLNKKYGDLLNRNYINDDFIETLKPKYNKKEHINLVDMLLKFIENFKYELGNSEHILKNNERTFEIEFYLIYDKLVNVLGSVGACDKFIFYVCNVFNIDYSAVSQLKNSIHLINRSYPNFRYNNRYFMQELVTLYTYKGLSKGTIGSKVLNKDSSFLYNGTNKKYASIINEEDLSWQYVPTIEWSNLNKNAIIKFIQLFHTFIKYDI